MSYILRTLIVFFATFSSSSAEHCACATTNVNIRSGAGVRNSILTTIYSGDCLSYKGDQVSVGSTHWAHVDYKGQDAYVSTGYVKFQECTITAPARKCACATGSVHVRNGAGTSHHVIGTLTSGKCYTYKGQMLHDGSFDWVHLDYNGKDGWTAANWITIEDCKGSSSGGSSGSSQLPGCPHIVSRAGWNARPERDHPGSLPNTPQNVYIHHGASASCHTEAECTTIMHSYQSYHMDSHGWPDIGYSFVIGEDGNVYEARGWDKVGSHTNNHNSDGLGFCVIGDFTDHVPNDAALNAVKKLIACGVSNNKIRSDYIVYGHRDLVKTTSCPGQKFYELIRTWAHYKSS